MKRPETSVPTLRPIFGVLRAYWRSDRWMLLLVAGVVAGSSAAAVGGPYVFSRLIDRMGQTPVVETLTTAFLAYALLLGVGAVLTRLVTFLSLMSAENLSFIASTAFFDQLSRKTPAFFIEHNPAQIQDAGEKGKNSLGVLAQLGLMILIPGLIQIALAIALLGTTIDLGIAAAVLLYGVAYIALSRLANSRTEPYLEAAIAGDQENARLVGNAVQAMETLRHFGAGDWARRRFELGASDIRNNWRAYSLRHAAFGALFGLALCVQLAISYLVLLPRYGAGALSLGDLVLFNTLLLQLNRPFEMVGSTLDQLARARADLGPMAAMWAAPVEEEDDGGADSEISRGRVAFEAVSHVYDNGRGLRGASFVAERGRITFLVGETGAGKSTAFRLALKSIAPQDGRILVDGIDLAGIGRAQWARAAATVPQDAVLLNESLEANILLGRPKDPARLREAARRAAILEFIDALPEGFATTVGERGLKLSGGERQRIAIARALYGDPAILFLDEASSALDVATERDVIAHLRAIQDRVTILAITHRRGVIAADDRVVTLAGGPKENSGPQEGDRSSLT